MRVLVTGVAGFIGMHTAERLLARGDDVVGIDVVNDYYDVTLKEARLAKLRDAYGERFQFVKVDFSDMASLQAALVGREFERIVHLGAQAGVRYSIENPHAYIQSNIVGHLNLLEIARARRTEHFVYASSSSVYGSNDTLPFRVEDRVEQPRSLYAATKRSDELISESYAHLYRLPQTGLRFFTVYGPWGRPDMAMWIFSKAILEGTRLPVFNNGQMERDFTFIDDIISGVVGCLDAPPADDGQAKAGGSYSPHRLYNIGNHRSEPLGKVISLLEEAFGKRAEIEYLPMQPGDVAATYADIEAIRRDIGFEPLTSIDVGVPTFARWYLDYRARQDAVRG